MWRPDAACSCADVALCKRAACHYRQANPVAPLWRLHPISLLWRSLKHPRTRQPEAMRPVARAQHS